MSSDNTTYKNQNPSFDCIAILKNADKPNRDGNSQGCDVREHSTGNEGKTPGETEPNKDSVLEIPPLPGASAGADR
jgi:hypothetical protein